MVDGVLDLKDTAENQIKEVLLGCVSEKAKPCITKAFDYTLLMGLLMLQYMRCKPEFNKEMNIPVYECASNNTLLFSTDSSDSLEENVRNNMVLAAIITGISYGILLSIIVGVHAYFQSKDVKIHSMTASLYKCTDKILIIDSALEIPISFFWAPIMTVILWGFFAAASFGLYRLIIHFELQADGDDSATDVFTTSAALTLLSLFTLTGETLQYWVFYKAATREDAEILFHKFQLKTKKVKKRKKNLMLTFSKKKIANSGSAESC